MEKLQYQKLGDLVDLKTTKQALVKSQYLEDGIYNVISSASKPAGKYDQFNEAGGQITISKDGTCGVILWHEQPFYLADGAFVVKIKPDVDLDARYLYHYLKRSQGEINEMQVGQPIAHLYKADLYQLKVYVPDLATQQAIASALDQFMQLKDQLNQELSLRQKQYQYYLKTLLDFENPEHPFVKNGGGVNSKIPLGEIVEFKMGNRIKNLSILKQTTGLSTGVYDIVSSAIKPIGKWNQFNYQGQTITITKDGDCGNVAWQEQPFWATEHSLVLTNKVDQISPKYLYYYLKAIEYKIKELKIQSAPDFIRISDLKALKIKIPPLAIQSQIINALDQLSTLCNDLSTGLPAQIANANKQYQYYLKEIFN